MPLKVLIVEDEMLVACHMEALVEDLGFQPAGIAADAAQARELAEQAPDIALVDLNLRDGLTGPEIGSYLGARGVSVVYVTANPCELKPPVPGALGVVSKPCNDDSIESALQFAMLSRLGQSPTPPPAMRLL
jgi:CheY-like chemotaxis protein